MEFLGVFSSLLGILAAFLSIFTQNIQTYLENKSWYHFGPKAIVGITTSLVAIVFAYFGFAFGGMNAIDDNHYLSWLYDDKLSQYRFMDDFKSQSDEALTHWDANLSRGAFNENATEGELIGSTEQALNQIISFASAQSNSNELTIQGRADLLGLKSQFRYYYYLANLYIASAFITSTDQLSKVNKAIALANTLEDFVSNNKESLGDSWINTAKIESRIVHIKLSANCMKAMNPDYSKTDNSELLIKDLKNKINIQLRGAGSGPLFLNEDYIKGRLINSKHPILGRCMFDDTKNYLDGLYN